MSYSSDFATAKHPAARFHSAALRFPSRAVNTMQPLVKGRTKSVIRKVLPKDTEAESAGDESIPSKDGYNVEATATGSDVKPTESQDEALKHERPHRKQATKEALSNDLNAIDTWQSISTLIHQKRKTLKPLYEWVCSTPEYVKFAKGDACMLWVSGADGTGMTMLMLAMIDGISRQRRESSDSTLLSYSFCGSGQPRPVNAASVVKVSSIWC